MFTFEYAAVVYTADDATLVIKPDDVTATTTAEAINEAGSLGWEGYAAHHVPQGSGAGVVAVYLKRPTGVLGT